MHSADKSWKLLNLHLKVLALFKSPTHHKLDLLFHFKIVSFYAWFPLIYISLPYVVGSSDGWLATRNFSEGHHVVRWQTFIARPNTIDRRYFEWVNSEGRQVGHIITCLCSVCCNHLQKLNCYHLSFRDIFFEPDVKTNLSPLPQEYVWYSEISHCSAHAKAVTKTVPHFDCQTS